MSTSVLPMYTRAAPYSTMVQAPTPQQGPTNTGVVAPTTVFAPYSAIVPASNVVGAGGVTTSASMMQAPALFSGTIGTVAGSTIAPTRAHPDQTLPLQAKTLTTITDAKNAANLIPSYAGNLGVGNYNAAILPITHTVHSILPPALTDANVVHCNPTPTDAFKMTHDSKTQKKREKRAKKIAKALAKHPETVRSVADNRILPFGVPFKEFYAEKDRIPGWYNNAIYHAGPAAPYVEKFII